MMKKLSKEILPFEVWTRARTNLKFYWLKDKDMPCCVHKSEEKSFVIYYDINSQTLNYDDLDDTIYCLLLPLKEENIQPLADKDVQRLMCSSYLLQLIDKFYDNGEF